MKNFHLYRLYRRVAAAVLAIALAACGSDTTTTTVDGNLDGPWSSHDFNIGVVLNLTWTADSVKGSGSYTVLQNSLGCGGSTLHGDGTVMFAASISSGNIVGRMSFDNGWAPPYRGTLTGTSIAGAFQSIDAGQGPFPLYKGLVP
jgi:hypothetical protein